MAILSLLKRLSKKEEDVKEDFMVRLNKSFKCETPPPLTCKRSIFISLIGLFQTYDSCPPYILYSAVFILPLQRQWVLSPSKFLHNIQAVSAGLIKNDTRGQHFFELLQWKDAQGLVIWANEQYEELSTETMIHPFYQYVFQKLATLYDPITSKKYEPLPPEVEMETFWITQIQKRSNRYSKCTTACDLICELYFKCLKFECMKMIFDAVNPGSLDVITAYSDRKIEFVKIEPTDEDFESDEDKHVNDEWWISPDYFY